METGTSVWLHSPESAWGWIPARIADKETVTANNRECWRVTLVNDDYSANANGGRSSSIQNSELQFYSSLPKFSTVLILNPNQKDHPEIKLRNTPSNGLNAVTNGMNEGGSDNVDDLINLTHLHEPAILHSLRLRYGEDCIYTSTGPILISINPFKKMGDLYGEVVMQRYREMGEGGCSSSISKSTSVLSRQGDKLQGSTTASAKANTQDRSTGNKLMYTNVLKKSDHSKKLWENDQYNATAEVKTCRKSTLKNTDKLPPHPYKTADDAYRAMMRGLENAVLTNNRNGCGGGPTGIVKGENQKNVLQPSDLVPTNQSILVSGESGAGKTVTTKIVLNYFAMLSKKITVAHSREFTRRRQSFSPRKDGEEDIVSIEQQVLQSNPILEAFGNARTLRNDNSSRFGKYIDIQFTNRGKLSGAKIETYLLEKVRLIHPSEGERNYHVFYQFLARASCEERKAYMLDGTTLESPRPNVRGGYGKQTKIGIEDFKLLNQTGTYDRRDKVSDGNMHDEMLEAMLTVGFTPDTIHSLMRLISAILHCGNMTFTSTEHNNARGHADGCDLDKTPSSIAAAELLGVTFDDLSEALTTRAIRAGNEIVHTPMDMTQSKKACEALIKATYGAAFDFIVSKVNESISSYQPNANGTASIGVLDIFGFETFDTNNFEQICINYTNEALQQQFNKYVFKLEQDEYEREGILWSFISFPDNQEILDLIDRKHTGIFATLDEQCIVPSTDQKFTRFLYNKCKEHPRFCASASQKVHHKFTIEHYAGPVEYTTDNWLEKNKDQMPSASVDLIKGANFELLSQIQQYIRSEREGRGSVASKTVAAQFSSQLRELRSRIDTTVPHYIRCLKPNDELVPNRFDPKMIIDQLRCGGVLEAVRVSRAGYQIKHLHDVFRARYSFLGDPQTRSNSTVRNDIVFGKKLNATNGEKSIKKLIEKIALDIWKVEHKAKSQHESSMPVTQPREQIRSSTTSNRSTFLSSRTAFLSETERKDSFKENQLDQSDTLSSGSIRPQSTQDFLALSFATRCALAGLQLGRTKVFLRREAFDRIEALRALKFGKAAITIQKIARGIQARALFKTNYLSGRRPHKALLSDHLCSFSSMRDEYMRTASSISVDSRNDSEGEPRTTEMRTLRSVEGKFQVWPPLKSSGSLDTNCR